LAVVSLQRTGNAAKKVQTVQPQRQFTTNQRNRAADFAAGAAKEFSAYNHGLQYKAGVRASSPLTPGGSSIATCRLYSEDDYV
jgi:hypothetical protein